MINFSSFFKQDEEKKTKEKDLIDLLIDRIYEPEEYTPAKDPRKKEYMRDPSKKEREQLERDLLRLPFDVMMLPFGSEIESLENIAAAGITIPQSIYARSVALSDPQRAAEIANKDILLTQKTAAKVGADPKKALLKQAKASGKTLLKASLLKALTKGFSTSPIQQEVAFKGGPAAARPEEALQSAFSTALNSGKIKEAISIANKVTNPEVRAGLLNLLKMLGHLPK